MVNGEILDFTKLWCLRKKNMRNISAMNVCSGENVQKLRLQVLAPGYLRNKICKNHIWKYSKLMANRVALRWHLRFHILWGKMSNICQGQYYEHKSHSSLNFMFLEICTFPKVWDVHGSTDSGVMLSLHTKAVPSGTFNLVPDGSDSLLCNWKMLVHTETLSYTLSLTDQLQLQSRFLIIQRF